jgi:pyridoxine 4-dehydrogenase
MTMARILIHNASVLLVAISTCLSVQGFVPLQLTAFSHRTEAIRLSMVESSRRDFVNTVGFAASAGLWLPSSPAQAATASTSIQLPPMGLGAWAWGDSVFWKYDPKEDDELHRVFDYAISQSSSSPVLFDTAEIYGFGRSETLLGQFSKECAPEKIQIASKFAALPWRSKAKDVVSACLASVDRLQGRPIDLYQIHFPNVWNNADYWEGLAECYERGLVKAVGVSNYGSDAVRACHGALAKHGIPLATNQIQCSLLYRWPLENGLLDTCKELDVQVLSYSPLALGFLTGKYNDANLPTGPRQGIFKQLLGTPDYENLLSVMQQVAEKHDGATLSQVAINWTRAKGTIPIPGARTVNQVSQNYGALSWNLSKEEETMLDDAAAKVTTFITPDKNPFPKQDINTKLVMYDS